MKLKIKKTLPIFLFTALFFSQFFLFTHEVGAVDCQAQIQFGVTPQSVPMGSKIVLSGYVKSTQFNPKGYSALGDLGGDGFCDGNFILGTKATVRRFLVVVGDNEREINRIADPSSNPVTMLQQLIVDSTRSGLIGNLSYINYKEVALKQYDNTSQYPFSFEMDPGYSGFGYKPGDRITLYAKVAALNNAGAFAGLLTQAAPVTVELKNQTYACVANNGTGQYVYACSPGRKQDLSDVSNNACAGKSPGILVDVQQCGQALPIYACVAGDGKYACSPGNKSNLSDVPACSGKASVQIGSDLCGKVAPSSSGGSGQTGSTPPPGNTGQKVDCIATPNSPNCLYNPLPTGDLTTMFLLIAKGTLGLVAVWAVIFIIVGGFRMVTAAGNEEAYGVAKKTVTWAVIGVVVAVLSFSIVAIVENILKANIQ